jgi:hypothetical protein
MAAPVMPCSLEYAWYCMYFNSSSFVLLILGILTCSGLLYQATTHITANPELLDVKLFQVPYDV